MNSGEEWHRNFYNIWLAPIEFWQWSFRQWQRVSLRLGTNPGKEDSSWLSFDTWSKRIVFLPKITLKKPWKGPEPLEFSSTLSSLIVSRSKLVGKKWKRYGQECANESEKPKIRSLISNISHQFKHFRPVFSINESTFLHRNETTRTTEHIGRSNKVG